MPAPTKEAVKWYRLAAEQGHANAQFSLGVMYDNGKGVPQDYKEAVKWLRLAASQGYANAQFGLGVMYDNGQGVPKSMVVAYAFYNLSAANDSSDANKEAAVNRGSLIEKMSKQEISAAQELTREIAKSDNLLKVIDKYIKHQAVK